MVKAVIVDDEIHARESISRMLNVYYPSITVIGKAESIKSAYDLIKTQCPDIVFLDMQLTDGHGFDLLKMFEDIPFKVIIVSAHQEYAVKAFKFSAVDYLLKPVDPEDLVKAVDIALAQAFSDKQQERLNALIENTKNIGKKEKLLALRNSDGTYIVNTSEIVRCEPDNNATIFYLVDGNKIKVSRTLKEFDEMLNECGFLRCHQSHLINQRHIEKISRFPKSRITMSNGDVVPVSFRKIKSI
ncbi:MAG TPA: response regulator transcription factor [Bacteroidales bacterium]|nr:response regulator transcription factor [Bacteroidales bacterium]